jgi:aspartate carbamoyltransferase regulatory subunit
MMTNETQKVLTVSAIEDGTVIDHIQSGQALRIVRLLKLSHHPQRVSIGMNLPSSRFGLKDLIKVEGKELTPEETNQIAIFSPQTTLNIIKDYRVIKKFTVTLPEVIENILECPNPHCISNHADTNHTLYVNRVRGKIQMRCKYCDKLFTQDEFNESFAC